MLGILRTSDYIQRHVAKILEPGGISPQQYNVLRIMRGAGEQGIPTLEIGERMIEKSPGITRLIDRLEAHGWAERNRCKEDRRVVYCRITKAGLELLAAMEEPMSRADSVVSHLSREEQTTLINLLDRIREFDKGQ